MSASTLALPGMRAVFNSSMHNSSRHNANSAPRKFRPGLDPFPASFRERAHAVTESLWTDRDSHPFQFLAPPRQRNQHGQRFQHWLRAGLHEVHQQLVSLCLLYRAEEGCHDAPIDGQDATPRRPISPTCPWAHQWTSLAGPEPCCACPRCSV